MDVVALLTFALPLLSDLRWSPFESSLSLSQFPLALSFPPSVSRALLQRCQRFLCPPIAQDLVITITPSVQHQHFVCYISFCWSLPLVSLFLLCLRLTLALNVFSFISLSESFYWSFVFPDEMRTADPPRAELWALQCGYSIESVIFFCRMAFFLTLAHLCLSLVCLWSFIKCSYSMCWLCKDMKKFCVCSSLNKTVRCLSLACAANGKMRNLFCGRRRIKQSILFWRVKSSQVDQLTLRCP